MVRNYQPKTHRKPADRNLRVRFTKREQIDAEQARRGLEPRFHHLP